MATDLQNIRIPGDLWRASDAACKAHGTNRSQVARNALQREVDMETDPVLSEALRLANKRGTTVDALERTALEQYLRRQKRTP